MICVLRSRAVGNFPDWPSLVVCLVTSFVGYIKVFWNTTFLISLPVGSVKNFDLKSYMEGILRTIVL